MPSCPLAQGFREKYREWFEGAKPLLEVHQDPAAFKGKPISFRGREITKRP